MDGACADCAGVGAAAVWIGSAAVAALVISFLLRRKIPAPIVAASLAACGAALGWGGLLVQAHETTAERVLAIGTLALMVPVHVRIVLGRFGPG